MACRQHGEWCNTPLWCYLHGDVSPATDPSSSGARQAADMLANVDRYRADSGLHLTNKRTGLSLRADLVDVWIKESDALRACADALEAPRESQPEVPRPSCDTCRRLQEKLALNERDHQDRLSHITALTQDLEQAHAEIAALRACADALDAARKP